MIRFFKQKTPFLYIFLFFYTFLLNAVLFFKPFQLGNLEHSLIGQLFSLNFTFYSSNLIIIASVILTFFQALIVNQIFNKFGLTSEVNLLPSFIFITVEALFPEAILLNPAFISMFIILIMMNYLLTLFDMHDATQRLFFISFLIGLGGMIFSPLYLYILSILIALPILKSPKTGEFAIIPFGFIIPIYIVGIVYYMKGDLNLFLGQFSNSIPEFTFEFKGKLLPGILPIGYLFLVLAIGFFKDFFIYTNKIVRLTRYHRVFTVFFVFTILLFLFTSVHKASLSYYFIMPVTFFLSSMFSSENSKLNEIIFGALLLIIGFLQLNLVIHLI
ncbi:hypothetical protein ACFLRI_04980 [Bacteroidota bacterium]